MKDNTFPIIRLAMADSQTAMREAVCHRLHSLGKFVLEIQAGNGRELIKQLAKVDLLPNTCVIEVTMKDTDGFQTLREIKSLWPSVNVLVFTSIDNQYTVTEMMKLGANGYLLKDSPFNELVKALTDIYLDGYYHSEIVFKSLMKSTNKGGNCLPTISGREKEFLSFLSKNYSYLEIAKIMNVSPRTVEGYHNSLANKLKMKNRSELTKFAIDMGLSQSAI